jgi:hypothetical protein
LTAVAHAQISPAAAALAVTVRSGVVTAPVVVPGSEAWLGWSRQANSGTGNAFATVGHAASSTAITGAWQFGCLAGTAASSPAEASVAMRYEFLALHAFVGRLVVEWTPSTSGTGAAGLAIDVGDDGSVEAQGAATIPIAFGPGPLAVRVAGTCTATAGTIQGPFGSSWSWAGSAYGNLTLRLEATHASTTFVGTPCGSAPSLAVLPDLVDGIEVRGVCAPTSDLALLAIGFQSAVTPLPLPPACTLLVVPELVDAQWPDALGRVTWSFAAPPAVRPVTLRMQLFGLDAATFTLAASACARTDVP